MKKFHPHSCGTCQAFARNQTVQGQVTGTCRAQPPQGVPHVAVNPVSRQPEVSLLGGWPPVADTDWCLAWQAIASAREAA